MNKKSTNTLYFFVVVANDNQKSEHPSTHDSGCNLVIFLKEMGLIKDRPRDITA